VVARQCRFRAAAPLIFGDGGGGGGRLVNCIASKL